MMFITLLILFSLKLFAICDQDQVKSPHWVDICELFGGHLAQIDNLAENYCLLDYAQSQSLEETWWHSGNDIEREGVYRQADMELILWSPIWWGGVKDPMGPDPNGGTSENCLNVNTFASNAAGKWGDWPCSTELKFICER